MADETVARGVVEIRGDDSQLQRTLDKAEADYQRTMASISRMRAEGTVTVDLKEFKAELKEAKAQLEAFDKEHADVKLTVDDKQLRKALQDEVKYRKAVVDEQTKEVNLVKAKNKEETLNTRIVEAAQKREATRAQAQARWDKQRQDAVRKTQALQERADRVAEQAATRAAALAQRAEQQRQREIAQIPQMQRAYVDLQKKIDRLNSSKSKLTDNAHGQRQIINLDIASAERQMATLHGRLTAIGATPVTQRVDVQAGHDFGASLRRTIHDGFNDGGVKRAARDAGMLTGIVFGDAVRDGVASHLSPRAIGATITRGFARVGDVLGNLSDATIRLGPFTTSIRGAVAGLAVLGPIIVDLVGALGSLVSVAGAAALGVGALGLGASGLVLGLGGITLLMKPLLGDFKNLNTLSKAAHTAMLKYGEGSKQAKQAQKQLNEALQNSDPATRQAFVGIEKLRTSWAKYVDLARPAFGRDLSQTLQTLNSDVGIFGKRSVGAFNAASTGWQKWMRGLRGAEAHNILDQVFANGNKAIGPLMHGLGNLATYLARVARIASTNIPGLAKTFDRWTGSIKETSAAGQGLTERVQNVIDKAKDVGNFFLAAGRFVKAFFAGGVDAGDNFVNTMTNALNRWTEFLNTGKGQSDLHTFFTQSVQGAQALYSALAPLIASFVTWAIEIAPIARAFFQGAGAVSHFASALLRVTALQGPIAAIVSTLGALWAINRISSATRALTGFVGALSGVGKAQKAIAGAEAAGGLANVIGGAGAAGGVAKVGAELERTAVKGGKLRTLLMGLGTGAGLNPWIAAAVGLGVALTALRSKAKSAHDEFDDLGKSAQQNASDARDMGDATANAGSQVQRSNLQLAQAKKYLDNTKKGTLEHKQALLDYRDAQRQVTESDKAWNDTQGKYIGNLSTSEAKLKDRVTVFDQAHKAEVDRLKDIARYNPSEARRADAEARLNLLAERRAKLLPGVERAENRVAASSANMARAAQGMVPVVGQAEQALGRLAKAGGSTIARKIAVKFESSGDVNKVASDAARALKSGVPQKVVTKIVADSKNADEAIRKINAQVRGLEARAVAIKIGADDHTAGTIGKIIARVNSLPEGKAKVRAIDAATATIARIVSRITGIPGKDAKLIARDLISGKAAAATAAISRIPNKTVTITARANLTPFDAALAKLNALHDKTITLTTVSNSAKSVKNSRASGRGPDGKMKAWVGEGSNWQGAKELIADHKTGAVQQVDGPTVMSLSPSQSVIPIEEPRFLGRGRQIAKKFMADTGMDLPRFAKGKVQGAAFGKGGLNGAGGDTEKLKGVVAYRAAQKAESNANKQLSVDQNAVKEPEELVIGSGTPQDPYRPNQSAIDSYNTAQSKVIADWDKLSGQIVGDLESAYTAATRDLDKYKTARQNNINALQKVRAHDKSIMEQSIPDKTKSKNKDVQKANADRIKKAKKRQDSAKHWYKTTGDMIDSENGKINDANSTRKDIDDDHEDLTYRKADYSQGGADARSDQAAISNKASESARSQQADADKSAADAAASAPTAADLAIGGADANAALVAAGMPGLAGHPSDAAGAINEQINAQKGKLAEGKAMLSDNNPSNDLEAFGIISSAASSIQSLNSALTDLANTTTAAATGASDVASMGTQYMALGGAIADLTKSMGNNFGMAGQIGQASAAMSGFGSGGAFGPNSAALGFSGAGPAGVAGGPGYGGSPVSIVNNFAAPPPDPHTWSQGVSFELQAAL